MSDRKPTPPTLVPRIFVTKVPGFDVCGTCGRQDVFHVRQLVFGWNEKAVLTATPNGSTAVSLCDTCRDTTLAVLKDSAGWLLAPKTDVSDG